MHPLKPFFFTLKVLLLLLCFLTLKPLVDANTRNLIGFNIQQVTLNTNNNSFAYESDDEDIINRTPLTIESEIIAEELRYLMKFRVKTYKNYEDTYAIPDTGSDLIWLQNRICEIDKNECYFDPEVHEFIEKPKDPIECKDCKENLPELMKKECKTEEEDCKYSGTYGDGSKTEGTLGKAEFKFTAINYKHETVKSKIYIGFSPKLDGEDKYSKNLYQGVVGLGQGHPSLIKQYEKIKTAAFSYYLPQFRHKDVEAIKARSKFRFGDDVKISDKNTSLLPKNGNNDDCDIRYCVHLEGISLKFEDENKEIKTKTHKVMIIDSGTTFTHLTSDIFEDFKKNITEKLNVEPTKFENHYDNCFEKNDENIKKLEKLEKISFEFSGTKIDLKRENFLDDFTPPIKSNEDQKHYTCLTVEKENVNYYKRLRNYGIKSSKGKYHILGSRAQMDFLVAFNLTEGNKIVSFDHLEDKHIEESLVLSSE